MLFIDTALDENSEIWYGTKGDAVPQRKTFLGSLTAGLTPVTLWTHEAAGDNHVARDEVKSILSDTGQSFDNPKPTSLLQLILQLSSGPDSLILDSFAGSGTTGHSVLNLNKLDGGNRRFILVEMEEDIAQKITSERVRRVAKGYTNSKGNSVEALGGGFRYCELGEPIFDETGKIRETVRFADLARHVYFSETGEPLPRERVPNTPLLGVCRGVAIYLLYNGILGDKSSNGGNVLTRAVLSKLPPFKGQKVIYCAGCLLGRDRLQSEKVIVRQTPYEIKVS